MHMVGLEGIVPQLSGPGGCNNFYENSSSWACSNSSHHNKNFIII